MQRLLSRLVRVTAPPFRVAELEGDAIFFYAETNAGDRQSFAAAASAQFAALFRAFDAEREALKCLKTCPCEACLRIGELELKQVAHRGRASFQTIGAHQKLFGLDVVLVHRMLKNSVPEKRYLLLTDTAFETLKPDAAPAPREGEETLDGVGAVGTRVYAGADLDAYIASLPPFSAGAPADSGPAWFWKMRMQIRTLLAGYRRSASE